LDNVCVPSGIARTARSHSASDAWIDRVTARRVLPLELRH
jgi:hypothetical protein